MLVTRRRTERPRAPLLQLDIDFRFSLYRIGGRRRDRGVSFGGATLGIPPLLKWKPNPEPVKPGRGQCLVGSLTGAVASQRVTEAPKGSLSMFGNHAQSVKVEGSLTARPTSRAGTKVGLSDPAVPYGRAVAHRIKGTPGITGLYPPRVHIDGVVWHLDVGSSHPGAEAGPKGSSVRRLMWHASWV